jgi:hypothetical protein
MADFARILKIIGISRLETISGHFNPSDQAKIDPKTRLILPPAPRLKTGAQKRPKSSRKTAQKMPLKIASPGHQTGGAFRAVRQGCHS